MWRPCASEPWAVPSRLTRSPPTCHFQPGRRGCRLFDERRPAVGDEARRAWDWQMEIAAEYPQAQITRTFGGKQYTFRYNNFDGVLIIEFPLD